MLVRASTEPQSLDDLLATALRRRDAELTALAATLPDGKTANLFLATHGRGVLANDEVI